MNLLRSKSHNAAAEDSLVDHLDELRKANSRLRLLVCQLLNKNQQLRSQCTAEEVARAEPRSALAIHWSSR